MRTTLLCLLLLISCISVHAQQTKPSYTLPDWVAMIDHPSTNYFEAIRSFEAYWAGKEKPGEEEEAETAKDEQEREKEANHRSSLSTEEREYELLLAYHYKRFKNWIQEMKPFVQDDGRILSMDERMNIWYRQQAELRERNR